MICDALCPSDIHPNAPRDKEIETTGFQNMVLSPVEDEKETTGRAHFTTLVQTVKMKEKFFF